MKLKKRRKKEETSVIVIGAHLRVDVEATARGAGDSAH